MFKPDASSQSVGNFREFGSIKLLSNVTRSHREEYLKTAINPENDHQPGGNSAYLSKVLGTIWQNLQRKDINIYFLLLKPF